MSVDPMKVIEDAVLEFTDKKDLFLAYMSSMIVGGPGEENNKVLSKLKCFETVNGKYKNKTYLQKNLIKLISSLVLGEPATPVVNVVTEKGLFFFFITVL